MSDTQSTEKPNYLRPILMLAGLILFVFVGWQATGVAQCYARGGMFDLKLGGVTCMIPLPPS